VRPPASLLRLALSKDNKTAILHSPEVELEGDSAVLMELAAVLQDLELDWEYELSRWIGPVASAS
jgi:ubiquinone biosynthesis accessory factor UbiJ